MSCNNCGALPVCSSRARPHAMRPNSPQPAQKLTATTRPLPPGEHRPHPSRLPAPRLPGPRSPPPACRPLPHTRATRRPAPPPPPPPDLRRTLLDLCGGKFSSASLLATPCTRCSCGPRELAAKHGFHGFRRRRVVAGGAPARGRQGHAPAPAARCSALPESRARRTPGGGARRPVPGPLRAAAAREPRAGQQPALTRVATAPAAGAYTTARTVGGARAGGKVLMLGESRVLRALARAVKPPSGLCKRPRCQRAKELWTRALETPERVRRLWSPFAAEKRGLPRPQAPLSTERGAPRDAETETRRRRQPEEALVLMQSPLSLNPLLSLVRSLAPAPPLALSSPSSLSLPFSLSLCASTGRACSVSNSTARAVVASALPRRRSRRLCRHERCSEGNGRCRPRRARRGRARRRRDSWTGG